MLTRIGMRKALQKGFTLLEMLIVLALIAILVGIILVSLNPARQFASARNSSRYSHVNTLINAISANMSENRGTFTCATGALPATGATAAQKNMTSDAGGYDIAPCLVPNFMSSMPYDPSAAGAHWTSAADYDSQYSVEIDATGRVTVSAPDAELGVAISVTR